MKQSAQLLAEHKDIVAIENTTHIFENVASIRIRQIKEQVLSSRQFFNRLWMIYTGLRLDKDSRVLAQNRREVRVLVSANVNLVGSVDAALLKQALTDFNSTTTDLIVIGAHGEHMLLEQGIVPKYSFALPDITKSLQIDEIVGVLQQYEAPIIYYPNFISLGDQQIVHFALIEAVRNLSEAERKERPEGLLSPDEYIFEPSPQEFVDYVESMILGTVLTEVILEASLAQFASRFSAMNMASHEARRIDRRLLRQASRARRHEHDELDRNYQPAQGVWTR
ncbi:F0F1 ATP synthase subunit gamma [Candidatus Saccharibacteria bacterium]|nr:F0F1 ATP synthase subunit gamma [Candidatus Saccharibacteria bacterium]